MNLAKLFKTQKGLREHINYKGPDRKEKLILALLVEVGECANEWRGFKFWSNKKPSVFIYTTEGATPENAEYFKCMNEEQCGEYSKKEDFVLLLDPDYEECPKCIEGQCVAYRKKFPLLEEYVDGLHFVLELGLEIDVDHEEWRFSPFLTQTVTEKFSETFESIIDFKQNSVEDEWIDLFEHYLGLGEMLGFTWNEIETAYFEKNKVNHQRQLDGY